MEHLMHLLENSGSTYQAVEVCEERLKKAGFEELDWHNVLCPVLGGKYYMNNAACLHCRPKEKLFSECPPLRSSYRPALS